MRMPWLIQRCKTQEFKPTLRTGEYLKLDYMGSSEFEFGAIPQWLRDVNKKISKMHIHSVLHEGVQLFFACESDQIKDYEEIMIQLMTGKVSLKERSGLTEKEVSFVGKRQVPMYDQPHAPFKFDVWLDLTNNLFFGRTEESVRNLFTTIPNSVHYMDQQAKARK